MFEKPIQLSGNNISGKFLRALVVVTLLPFGIVYTINLGATEHDTVLVPEFITGAIRVDAEEVVDLIDQIVDLKIIDSRINMDRKQGYLEGSESLPDILTNCASLQKHLSSNTAPVLFYCNGVKCLRSSKSVRIALDCGYKNVYWFRGGIQEWRDKGYPVLKSDMH